jgi:hypothetical protein
MKIDFFNSTKNTKNFHMHNATVTPLQDKSTNNNKELRISQEKLHYVIFLKQKINFK